jgi:hypothetical protein
MNYRIDPDLPVDIDVLSDALYECISQIDAIDRGAYGFTDSTDALRYYATCGGADRGELLKLYHRIKDQIEAVKEMVADQLRIAASRTDEAIKEGLRK